VGNLILKGNKMITQILLGIFFAPFILVVSYIVAKVTIDISLTILGDALSIVGYDNLRQYNLHRQ
jgi:hypothetical protein